MKVCYTAGPVKKLENCFSVSTNAVEIRIWFLTDDILRIRAGFDGDWDEASYSLTMTAWDSRTDELMKDCRKRVQTAAAELTDGDKQAVIQGSRLKVVVEKAPFRIMVYDKDGSLLHADIPDLAYREDSNHRRMHASQIEADDCFYGFGEKSGEINKAEKYMNMAPGDAMGYNAKETDSLYKHIPFYIKLNRGTKQAVGYFYHNTAECDFNMGREKRNYWHRYSTYRTDAGDVDLFLIAGPSIRDIIERYTDLTGKSVMLPKAALGYLGSSMYYPELPENSDDAVLEFIDTTHEEDIFITVIATFGTVISSSLVAYALSRVRFRGRKFWFTCMLVTMMLPTQVIMIPQYLIYYRLGLVPGYVPLILPYFCGQAFFIYQMMQFMQGIPKDLDEAATIDGCSKYQIYSRIILPLMKPSIVTTVIIQFYWKWDDYMGPLLYLSRPQSYTVSIAIKLFADSASTTDYGAMFAMSTLSLIPVFLIFLFFNRYLVQGIGTSGLKG